MSLSEHEVEQQAAKNGKFSVEMGEGVQKRLGDLFGKKQAPQ